MSEVKTPVTVRKQGPGAVQELSDEAKHKLLTSNWDLLTAPGSIAEITSTQAQYVALIRMHSETPGRKSSTFFVVAKDFQVHPDTSTVRNSVRRKGIEYSRELLVDMSTIRQIYDKAAIGNPKAAFANNLLGEGAAYRQSEFIRMLDMAARMNASDIHIKVDKFTAVIEFRADGVIMPISEMPAQAALELCNAAFNMTDTSESTYKPNDYQQARMTETSLKGLKFPEGVQSVRLQFNPQPGGGRYLVARLLYSQKIGSTADIDELGYAPNQIADIKKMRRKTIGINIICGPTGSGKSTTLQRSMTATMRERPGINAVTIEDPPEYIIEGAKQLPVVSAITAEERSKNFAIAMNAVLRDDPDLIMIGEIRDAISANLAYTAAETGHAVWASLHANSAIGILDRLRDLGVEMFKLTDASKFTGLVSQRLVRLIHPDLKCGFDEAVKHKLVSDDVFDVLAKLAGRHIDKVNFAATHRVQDANKAYKGRSVAAETIMLNQSFLDLYADGRKRDAIAYWKNEMNGIDMLEHGLGLIFSGKVDVRSVEDVVGLIDDIDPSRVAKILELVVV